MGSVLDEGSARNAVLEELISSEPQSDSIKLVYADWLLGRGARWGELIVEQHANPEPTRPLLEWPDTAGISSALTERPTNSAVYEASIGKLLPGKLPPVGCDRSEAAASLQQTIESEIFPSGSQPVVQWRCGFLAKVFLPQHAGFRDVLEGTLIRLLEHPAAIALEELALGEIEWSRPSGYHRGLHYQEEIAVLAVLAPRSLRRLVLGAWDEHDISWTAIGDLSPLYSALPNLTALELQGGFLEFGEMQLPRLRSLTIRSGGLYESAIESLHRADWPQLETLTIWFGQDEYGGPNDPSVADGFLRRERFPRLRRLGLANAEFTDGLCERLPQATVLPGLTHLDLSLGTMSDEGAEQLLQHSARLQHLEHLDVRGNWLSKAVSERLGKAFRSVDTRFQRVNNAWRRYPSVGE